MPTNLDPVNEFVSQVAEAMAAEDEATRAIIDRYDPRDLDRLVVSAIHIWLEIETTLPRKCELCAFFGDDGACGHGIKPMDAPTCDFWGRASLEAAMSEWVTLTDYRTHRAKPTPIEEVVADLEKIRQLIEDGGGSV